MQGILQERFKAKQVAGNTENFAGKYENMKILVIFCSILRMLPWHSFYLDEFKKYNCEVTVLTWNREGFEEIPADPNVDVKEFYCPIDNSENVFSKVKHYIEFSRYAHVEMKKENYDLVLVSTIQECLFLYGKLQNKYKGRYIYDMRDPWYETKPLISRIAANLVENSLITFVSSEAFKGLLPKNDKIFTTHNFRIQDKGRYEEIKKKKKERKIIRISFWGITREIETNIKFIDIIANDDRFELNYYGVLLNTSKEIFNYCTRKGIRNVKYKGTYGPEGRLGIAVDTDVIHNIYGLGPEKYDTRMTNKYYDGIIFEIPQLVYSGGFMGDCAKQAGVGLTIDLEKSDADKIYNYVTGLDSEKFRDSCRHEVKRIENEQACASEMLDKVIERQMREKYKK